MTDRIETLLRVRRRVLRQAISDHAETVHALEEARRRFAAKENEIDRERQLMAGDCIASQSDFELYVRAARKNLDALSSAAKAAEQRVSDSEGRLMEAFREVKVVEQVYARREATAKRAAKKAETATFDEIASMRHAALQTFER